MKMIILELMMVYIVLLYNIHFYLYILYTTAPLLTNQFYFVNFFTRNNFILFPFQPRTHLLFCIFAVALQKAYQRL